MVANASTAYRQAYPIAKGSAAVWNFDTPGNENRAGSNVLAIHPVGIRCTCLEGQRGGELVAKRTLHRDYVTKREFPQRV